MSQLTLYLDNDLEAKLRLAAKAANLSQSRWVANLIAEKLNNEWPPHIAALAGAWADTDIPLTAELRTDLAPDIPREPF
jgi:hypothetical protein